MFNIVLISGIFINFISKPICLIMKKAVKRILLIISAGIITFAIYYAWPRVPIITAFAAKGMCSSVFIAEKDPERVSLEDLSFFTISLAKTSIEQEEKSVTAKLFGLAKRKAVFREGLGAVLVLNTPEDTLRLQTLNIPVPGYRPDTLPWPKGDILPEKLPPGVDYTALKAILEEAFDIPGKQPRKKTLGISVVYDNVLIGEKYLDGYDAWTKFHAWSMAKSVMGSLVGILSGKGMMDVKAPTGIEEWKDDMEGVE